MKFHHKYYFFFLFALISLGIIAQEEIVASTAREAAPGTKQYYLISPRGSVTVPHPLSNKAFKKNFVGIYEFSVGLNIMFYKGLFVGGSYKNGLLKTTGNNVAHHNVSMTINNLAIKVGGDAYVNDNNKVIFSAAVSAGQNWTRYSGLANVDPNKHPLITSYRCTFAEPEMCLFFLVDPNFGIGATVTYSIFNKNFDPFELSLNEWASFEAYNPGATGYFSFGFGFYYSLFKQKK